MTPKDEVKELWKLCFDDDDDFIEMYFRLRYNDEVNVVIRKDEKAISALQMIPYPMTFCGHTVQTAYISGACTHPDFQGKGIMRDLLTQSFARMRDNGILFSTLIPAELWLLDYYKNMGYAPVFEYGEETVVLPGKALPKGISIRICPDYEEEVYQYLNRRLSERPCCIQHTPDDFKVILADLAVSEGCLFVARQENDLKGIAITYRKEDKILIQELFAENEETEFSLLYAIKQYAGDVTISRIIPCDSPSGCLALGMARVINAQKVLLIYAAAFPNEEMHLKLSDEQLPENNGYYYIYKGICTFSEVQISSNDFESLNTEELTYKMFSLLKPYMSLMLN